ncbi:MAG: P-type DNA transfer ATPase VirB11 [Pseudomonadota bacterium]|nr:P-type DNA transfer ATPase VirB11 [Pseudomonadota bacterium]
MAGSTYLENFLEPLAEYLTRPDVTDIYVNRPGELWLEAMSGGVERLEAPELSAKALDRLARQIAAFSHQGVNREHPILSASLPDGARIQIVIPPATRGSVAMAIRKHLVMDRSIADYCSDGSFDGVREVANDDGAALLHAVAAEQGAGAMLALAVRQRRNILISGGTSTGKSTFLNALLREIPDEERLILIEDTPELQLRHENAIGLLAARSQIGESLATSDDLLNASLRMRPDRIILGEIRGREAFTFLRAVNTGHPGSMSTIHADSPTRAIEQLALLVLQTGTQLRREDVISYVESVIDIFVQLERHNGQRLISEISFSARLMEQVSAGPVLAELPARRSA